MSSKIKNLNIYSCVDNPEVLKSSIFNGKLTGYPSIDRPWLKYYPIDLVIKDLPRCSIYRYIYDNNKKYSYRTALNYFGNKISYDEMFKNIDKTAAALVSIGVREGDIVTSMAIIRWGNKLSMLPIIAGILRTITGQELVRQNRNMMRRAWYMSLTTMFGKIMIGHHLSSILMDTIIKIGLQSN